MKIAITAYVDGGYAPELGEGQLVAINKFVDECNLMTYSGQCLDDRFTFVIYAHPNAAHLIDKHKNVKVIEYAPEENEYYSQYRFAKSLVFVSDISEQLKEYDYVIKTDTDVLFTPKMNDFIFDDRIYVGLGYYSSENQVKELKKYAHMLGYDSYERISDMHSTIICSSKDMIKIMKEADELCKKLYFTIDEPGEWHGNKLFKGFNHSNSGICSMYALEIILSSTPYKSRVVVTDKIDGSSTSDLYWDNYYHYHCWHIDSIYSKFQAMFGSYKNLDKQSGNSSATYCINTYIERRDLGIKYPEKFSKPYFTEFVAPPNYEKKVFFSFGKEVEYKKSIFVQISSYHDYELAPTIYDAIKKSSGKYNINFGVHVIYHENNDIEIPDLPNVKYQISKAPKNLGMGLGRLIAHNFYNGEDYYVQIDSHTRFDENWDEVFISDIESYRKMGFKKPLLTSYPRNYWYKNKEVAFDESLPNNITHISFNENPQSFKNLRIPSQTAVSNSNNNIFSKSVSGGAIFTVGDFIKPNPKIFANGEEIFIAARAWTNGYDLLLPSRHVIYHLYYDPSNKDINKRRLAWYDHIEHCNNLDAISKKEIFDMFDQNIIGEYHLGTERTLEEFGIYAGLDFKTGEIVDYCQ